jgi:hypothetical protein
VELPESGYEKPSLSETVLKGGVDSYDACRSEAARLKAGGSHRLEATSAALVASGASGWVVDPDITPCSIPRDGRVWVIYGPQPGLVGWPTVEAGAPPVRILNLINHL